MTLKKVILKSIGFGSDGLEITYLTPEDSEEPEEPEQPDEPEEPEEPPVDDTGFLPNTNKKTNDGITWNGWLSMPKEYWKDYPNHPPWWFEMDYNDKPSNPGDVIIRARLMSAPNYPVRLRVEYTDAVPDEDRVMVLRDLNDLLDIYQAEVEVEEDGCERWYDLRKELAWRKKEDAMYRSAVDCFRFVCDSKTNPGEKLVSPRFYIDYENLERVADWKGAD